MTVVDNDPSQTSRIDNELDVRVLTGSAAQSSVLFQADVIGTDICLAVTGSDEVNILAASMAKALGVRRAIARVYSPVFRDLSTFNYQRHFKIDRLLSLEQLTAAELARHIRDPGSVALENFARGELEVAEFEICDKTRSFAGPLRSLGLPTGVRVGSIRRGDLAWIAGGADALELGDRITLIGRRERVAKLRKSLSTQTRPKKRVVIAGGGETGLHLARTLENDRFSVLLVEESSRRCEMLSKILSSTTIIHADCTQQAMLEEERVGQADVFIACTGDDESNIMSSIEVRHLGAKQVMAVVGRPDYARLIGKIGIDVAVSARDVMARQILGFLNEGPVISHMQLPGGQLRIYEVDVLPSAAIAGKTLAELELPRQCSIVALLREDMVTVPGGHDQLRPGDVAVALLDESVVEETLALFAARE